MGSERILNTQNNSKKKKERKVGRLIPPDFKTPYNRQ